MNDDGNWHISTLGHFIGLLIDCGTGIEAAAYRIIKDSPPNDKGGFVRAMEVTLYANGSIVEALEGTRTVHKTLIALMEAGIVT